MLLVVPIAGTDVPGFFLLHKTPIPRLPSGEYPLEGRLNKSVSHRHAAIAKLSGRESGCGGRSATQCAARGGQPTAVSAPRGQSPDTTGCGGEHRRPRDRELATELLEAHHSPALPASDLEQLGIGIDDHRMSHRAEHRQV